MPNLLCRISIDRDPLTGRAGDTRIRHFPVRNLFSVHTLQMTEEGVYLSYDIEEGVSEDAAFGEELSRDVPTTGKLGAAGNPA
jgi:hypothetical protein